MLDFFFFIEIKLIDKVFLFIRWFNYIFCDIILSDILIIGEIKGFVNVIKEERGSWYFFLIILKCVVYMKYDMLFLIFVFGKFLSIWYRVL